MNEQLQLDLEALPEDEAAAVVADFLAAYAEVCAPRPNRCRCDRPLVFRPVELEEHRCARCGREVGS